jgi:hypothetical protein
MGCSPYFPRKNTGFRTLIDLLINTPLVKEVIKVNGDNVNGKGNVEQGGPSHEATVHESLYRVGNTGKWPVSD